VDLSLDLSLDYGMLVVSQSLGGDPSLRKCRGATLMLGGERCGDHDITTVVSRVAFPWLFLVDGPMFTCLSLRHS
jgi:hypothetical protein